MANRYWVGGTANWDATAGTKWALTSGGAGGQAVPTSNDDVFFDGSSGAITCTVSVILIIKSLSFSGFTGTFTNTAGHIMIIGGNLTFSAAMTLNCSNGYWQLSGGAVITSNGKTINGSILMNTATEVLTLADALVSTSHVFGDGSGSIVTNNFNLTCSRFNSLGSASATINLGTSTITVTGTGTVFKGIGTITSTGTIEITDTSATAKTFDGQGKTYGTLKTTGDNILITGNNTFSVLDINNGGRTNGLKVTAGSTQTVSSVIGNGSGGSLSKIQSSSAASAYTISVPATHLYGDNYFSIQDCTVSGGNWYAGTGSTSVSGNTNVIIANLFRVILTDTVAATETFIKFMRRIFSDTVTTIGTVTNMISKRVSEILTITENFYKSRLKLLMDTIVLAETFTKLYTRAWSSLSRLATIWDRQARNTAGSDWSKSQRVNNDGDWTRQ